MTDNTALPDSRGGDTLMVCWEDRHIWTWESGIIPTGTPCDCGVKMWRVGGCARCNEKDGEIQRLRAALEAIVAHEDRIRGGGLSTFYTISASYHIATDALAGKKGEEQP